MSDPVYRKLLPCQWAIRCANPLCPALGTSRSLCDSFDAWEEFKRQGWSEGDGRFLCPKCTQEFLNKGAKT